MLAGLLAGIVSGSSGGGGGGGGSDWGSIFRSGTTSSLSGNSGTRTMTGSGTLTIAYSGSGITFSVIKNGVSQGADTSLPVSSGDDIYFSASGSGFTTNEERDGTITVSNLVSDVIEVTLIRTSSE